MTHALAFDRVTFTYPEAEEPALRDVSFAVPSGAFVLVTGSTGAGKSTLLRACNGLVPHFTGGSFTGTVTVEGRTTSRFTPRELADVVGFVPQDPAAAFVLDRVEDELAYGMENLGVDPATMRRRVEETLDVMALEPLRTRSVRSLSGGERQRVAIASALTTAPRVLLLDEPTSQLDPQGAEDVLAALQRLVHDLGMTVLIAEHRLERVVGSVDAALACEGGRVRLGSAAELLRDAPNVPPVARLGRGLGWEPLPLTVREARRLAPRLAPPPPPVVPAPGPVLVEAARLDAGYDDTGVLRAVTLTARAGEVIAVMGRNGSGKSTLLRCIAGLHAPSSGTVTIAGGPPDAGRNVALCPQAPESILFKDSVRDEVEAGIRWTSTTVDPDDLLKRFGIARHAEVHPRDLSAGQRLLVAVAATAATGAPVLLLDEPTRGLDVATKRALGTALENHAARGGVVIFVSHDVELVAELAHKVVMLAGGEVIAEGPVAATIGDSPVFAPQMTRVFGPGWLTPEHVIPHVLAGSTT